MGICVLKRIVKLIKCHYAYLFSKVSIIILSSVVIFSAVIYITEAISLSHHSYIENINDYYMLSATVISLINIFFSSFLFSFSFQVKNDSYIQLIVAFGYSKKEYALSKIITLVLVILVLYFVEYIFFMIIGFIYLKGFTFNFLYLRYYINSFFMSNIYGIISTLLTIVMKNNFAFLIPLVIHIAFNSLIDSNGFVRVIYILFPEINLENGNSIYGISHLIWLLAISIIITINIYAYLEIRIE